MRSDRIKKIQNIFKKEQNVDAGASEWSKNFWLSEIALQLAKLNEKKMSQQERKSYIPRKVSRISGG